VLPSPKQDQTGGFKDYIYAAGRKVAKIDPSGIITYMLGDNLDSTALEMNASGAVQWQAEYTPLGQEVVNGTVLSPSLADGSANRYKFAGKERDTESGLDYFGARYYGSTVGRFTSPDWSASAQAVPYAKLVDPQSLNLYAYVGNNPIKQADVDGHLYGGSMMNFVLNDPNCGVPGACPGSESFVGWIEGIKTDAKNATDAKKSAQQQVSGGMTPTVPSFPAPALITDIAVIPTFTGSPAVAAANREAWQELMESPHARADSRAAALPPEPIVVIGVTSTVNRYDPRNASIVINPMAHPFLLTTAGWQQVPTSIAEGHELGHRVSRQDDVGPGRMNNVIEHENPDRRDLKLPERIEYCSHVENTYSFSFVDSFRKRNFRLGAKAPRHGDI